eukprot:672044-Alexandrium_andersonii.AAC.1
MGKGDVGHVLAVLASGLGEKIKAAAGTKSSAELVAMAENISQREIVANEPVIAAMIEHSDAKDHGQGGTR